MSNATEMNGRVAVITGGAGLLGREHAAALAEVGARVVVTDVDEAGARSVAAELSAGYDGRVHAERMDVTDPDSIRAVLERVVERFGRVDVLVNNAAVDPKVKSEGSTLESSRLERFALGQWRAELEVGLTGAFLCSQHFGTWMAEHGGGVIVNIASDLSVFAPDQRIYRKEGVAESEQPVKPVTYSVIKTGLVGLTRYLATYWADQGIRVNALSPGGVYTGQPEDFVQKLTRLIPLGRMAQAGEYRAALQFLCSDASRYMTGQNLVMDGGRSVW